MTRPLYDFIDSVRTADSLEQERFYITTEEAHIRAFTRDGDPELRPRVVSKLMFLDMLGENIAWGQMEAIKLMGHDTFSYKRVGYLGGAILLDETADLTVLVTHTLLKDLQSPDPNIQSLALAFIANVGNAEICRSVATEVQKLTASGVPGVMKRAGMAIVRIVRKNPDLTDQYKNTVQKLLNHSSHGVIIAGMNMVITMIEQDPKLVNSWSQFVLPFTKILKNLANSRGSREFNYGVFNDPYMLMKTMKALALLKKPSEELDSILQSIVSATDTRRNTGRAVLYQAVDTIVAIAMKPALRGLGFNQVGRLLSMHDPNVLYSALCSFARVLYREQSVLNRGSVDTMALQRYKSKIVQCLNHPDPSIRRRALDVISALIDEQNVETLVPEILAYVKLADSEFRSELVAKIYNATQKYARSPEWNFDTVHQILIDSGNYVSADILAAFCELISNSPEIQYHAVAKLAESIAIHQDNQSLLQVGSFALGEFAREEGEIIGNMQQILVLPQTKVETKLYIILALAKLGVRFGRVPEIIETMKAMEMSNNLEVQQRAGEMLRLLSVQSLSGAVLAPIVNTTALSEQTSVNIQPSRKTTKQESDNEEIDDLLQLVMDDAGAPPPAKPSSTLLELMGESKPQPAAPTPVQPQAQPQAPMGVQLAAVGDFVIFGQTQKNPQNPKQYALRLLFYNNSQTQLTDFKTDYKITPGWQINVQSIDGHVLAGKGGKPLSQIVYLLNQTNAKFSMQVRVSYKFGSQPLTENCIISILPDQ